MANTLHPDNNLYDIIKFNYCSFYELYNIWTCEGLFHAKWEIWNVYIIKKNVLYLYCNCIIMSKIDHFTLTEF